MELGDKICNTLRVYLKIDQICANNIQNKISYEINDIVWERAIRIETQIFNNVHNVKI